ncbi:unnamed protein product, partial [Mesorhabditis belari]|uniref:choline-phosphate cytidylyltransferase n=1 Tax=Mesorhabditis belari TaxID=2138241 RepID=A0AAF3F7K8_9BILA
MKNGEFVPLTLTEIKRGIKPVGRPIRILCEGVFDLFHIGHVEVLRQAKCALPDIVLVSGVNTDEEVLEVKGHLPVMTFKERLMALKTCRYVDEVIEDLPYFYTVDWLNKHQIDLVAHDDLPYVPNVLGENSPMFHFYDQFKVSKRQA